MQDPYKVLGIARDASDAEIKKAYRTLSRQYHPDANVNNPNKDLAEAKFKEVQQAYDQIMKEKEFGQSYSGGFNGAGGFYGRQETGQGGDETYVYMRAAANYIQSGHYQEALNVLNNIKDRNAQWYYFNGVANAGIGNNLKALEYAREAVRLDAGNMEYQMFLNQLEGGGTWYRNMQRPYEPFPVQSGSPCLRIIIANLICNLCCGGGGLCFGGGAPFR